MRRSTTPGAALAILLGSAALPYGAAPVAAQTPATESVIPAGEIPDVLRARVGKPVTLLLSSGKEYGGIVAEVRADAVVLRTLTGKEFFDAIVRLDDVSAVEMRRDR